MPAVNYIDLLNTVAQRAAALGFTINHTASKHPQIDLSFSSLKIVMDDETITSSFYLEDSTYNQINYPGFKDVHTANNVADNIYILQALKRRFERVIAIHEKILDLGKKIDDMKLRITSLGLVDKGNITGNYAINLLETNPTTISKPTHAATLPAIDWRKFLRRWRRAIQQGDKRTQQLMLENFKKLRQPGNAAPINPSVVSRPYDRSMPSHSSDIPATETTIANKLSEVFQKFPALRPFTTNINLRGLYTKRLVELGLSPRERSKQPGLTTQDIVRLIKFVQRLTGYQLQFIQLLARRNRTILVFRLRQLRGSHER